MRELKWKFGGPESRATMKKTNRRRIVRVSERERGRWGEGREEEGEGRKGRGGGREEEVGGTTRIEVALLGGVLNALVELGIPLFQPLELLHIHYEHSFQTHLILRST